MKVNTQGVIDNLQNVAGFAIGKLICKPFGLRFGKEHRGQHKWFSHVAANMAADGVEFDLLCYAMIVR